MRRGKILCYRRFAKVLGSAGLILVTHEVQRDKDHQRGEEQVRLQRCEKRDARSLLRHLEIVAAQHVAGAQRRDRPAAKDRPAQDGEPRGRSFSLTSFPRTVGSGGGL